MIENFEDFWVGRRVFIKLAAGGSQVRGLVKGTNLAGWLRVEVHGLGEASDKVRDVYMNPHYIVQINEMDNQE